MLYFPFTGIENDAIVIFSKYFSPDCLNPISISDDLRDQTVGQICHEDGTVDPRCFDNCQQYVFDLMETRSVAFTSGRACEIDTLC